MTALSGWGRFPKADCRVTRMHRAEDVAPAMGDAPLIARGNGRAYGDAALGSGQVLDMCGLDRMLSFDETTGTLVAEAGVLLADIIDTFLPRGFFPMVTPGTKFVSLGGAIAADVHGKNHHLDGAFRTCVDWIELMDGAGGVSRLHPRDDLFDWTIGGMGLTGVVLRAQIRLRRVETGYILQETRPTRSLAETIDVFTETAEAPYSVAWIDCSDGPHHGHALILLGQHARAVDLDTLRAKTPFPRARKARLNVPFGAPPMLFRGLPLRALNSIYWRRGARRAGQALVDWDRYFYPLDAVRNWNRAYGRAGFVQFQCALPDDRAAPGLSAIMDRIAQAQTGSVLSVLKRFGSEQGHVSFPMAGYTLALDFPANDRSLALMTDLDQLTLAHGGRFYLAKDARMPASVARADTRLSALAEMREKTGLKARFQSLQSERLGL